eukprot:TRINITY_DN3228_c0_g1::TRINITY_DN3228_c0_g1_i1::g.29724::m.29724 TRINITY_DN3228_c0_g1::TRINITY_DN3228_c0_g1_i1::g.29724  ORF type:complete len:250 (-),score=15.90,Cyclin/PF08613.6/3.1e-08,Cyclin_N/PF00134.18/0.0051 TRINITY_DN3228_c0_g1_i1:125-805(-)
MVAFGFTTDPVHVPLTTWLNELFLMTSVEEMMIASIYLRRLSKGQGGASILTRYNTHRVVLIAVMIAHKYLQDDASTMGTKDWLQAFPFWTLPAFNSIEVSMLRLLDWKTHVSPEEYHQTMFNANAMVQARVYSSYEAQACIQIDPCTSGGGVHRKLSYHGHCFDQHGNVINFKLETSTDVHHHHLLEHSSQGTHQEDVRRNASTVWKLIARSGRSLTLHPSSSRN